MRDEEFRVFRDAGGYFVSEVAEDIEKDQITVWSGPVELKAKTLDELMILLDLASDAVGAVIEDGVPFFEPQFGELKPTTLADDEAKQDEDDAEIERIMNGWKEDEDDEPTCSSPHCLRSKCIEKAGRR